VHAAFCLGGRHSLHSVHTGFLFQAGPRVLALDEIDRLVETALFGLSLFDDFKLPSAKRGVAPVHRGQVAREEVGLLAPLGATDLKITLRPTLGSRGSSNVSSVISRSGMSSSAWFISPRHCSRSVAGGLIEHLLGRVQILLGGLEAHPGVVDLG